MPSDCPAKFLCLWRERGFFGGLLEPPERETGCQERHPASVLGPGSALRLLPSMALSSAQVEWSVTEARRVVETRVKGAIPLAIGPSDEVFSWCDKHKGRTQWDRMPSVPEFLG